MYVDKIRSSSRRETSKCFLKKYLRQCRRNKAPGEDGIIAELIKNASQELKTRLYALIRKIWRDEKVPDDWKIGLIVPLYKNGV